MRLKAFRSGEQLIEYCIILANKEKLSREQIKEFVSQFLKIDIKRTDTNPENADAKQSTSLMAWRISELRKQLAELIED